MYVPKLARKGEEWFLVRFYSWEPCFEEGTVGASQCYFTGFRF